MSDANSDRLSPDAASPSSRIYVPIFRDDVLPGNFVVVREEGVGSGSFRANTQHHTVGRIIKNSSNEEYSAAIINVFAAPITLPQEHHGTIGPLRTPSTRHLAELVQTEELREVKTSQIARFANVFHNDILSSPDCRLYLNGMKDCYVVRFYYSLSNNR